MKRRFGWLGVLLLVCMAVCIVFIQAWEKGLFAPAPEGNPLPENMTLGPPVSSTAEATGSGGEDTTSTELDPRLPLVVSLDGTAQVDGVKFTLHSVTYAKDTQGMPPPTTFFQAYGDYDGTLVSEHTYVILDLTAENIDYGPPKLPNGEYVSPPEEYCFPMNNMHLVLYNGTEELARTGAVSEMAISDANLEKAGEKDRFMYYGFLVGDKLHYRIGFIVADEALRTMTDMYLLPAPRCNTRSYDEHTGKSYWSADCRFIWMNDMIADLTIPERTYIPPEATRPVCSEDDVLENKAHRIQVLGAETTAQLPEDAVLLQEESAGVQYVCIDLQHDCFMWQGSERTFETTPRLMVYNGEELAAELVPHAVLHDEKQMPYSPEDQEFKIPPESTVYYTLVYAVPEEYCTAEYDLLFNLYKWQTYDPATRTIVWKEDGTVVDLTSYLQGE